MCCNTYFVSQRNPNEGLLQASEPVHEAVQQQEKKEDPERRGSVRVTLYLDCTAKPWEQGHGNKARGGVLEHITKK